jgi:hypothetical protein
MFLAWLFSVPNPRFGLSIFFTGTTFLILDLFFHYKIKMAVNICLPPRSPEFRDFDIWLAFGHWFWFEKKTPKL